MRDNVNFEYAVQTLEKIIDRLENGDETLDAMLRLYKEGSKLVEICKDKLSEAEKEIDCEG